MIDLECDAAFKDLLEKVRALPEMTPREREVQSFSFAYGNLACTTNHKPTLSAFMALAWKRGWTPAQFEEWAKDKEWSR